MIADIVKHRQTGKVFLLLDEQGDHLLLVNPDGDRVSSPRRFFGEPDVSESADDLTPAQIEFLQARQASDQRAHREESAAPRPVQVTKVETSTPRRQGRKTTTNYKDRLTGVGATWSGSTLCFYRPQIDHLGLKQSFRVIVEGVGRFVISKEDFLKSFSDVVLHPKFKQDGFFAYPGVPEKAEIFREKS